MTPYALIDGEAILPLEPEIPSLCIVVHEKLTPMKNKLWLQELESLEVMRITVQQNLELYRLQISRL